MKVTLITARLRFDTAGGVTGTETGSGNNGTVLPIRKDPSGQATLPGTTIAGNLRAHCTALDAELGALFGDTPEQLDEKHRKAERENAEPERATPSTIQVLGTVLHRGGDTISHTRNTADRSRGAARTHHVHRVEMLTQGTQFDVVLRWDNANPDLLRDQFLPALKQWRPMLGRGVTRGAGRCSLVGWGTKDYDLDSAEGLLAWLRDTDLESRPEPSKEPANSAEPNRLLDADLSVVDALHCGTGDAETTPGGKNNQLKAFRHGTEFVVPGSTLKGVLRSRAEHICRVLGLAACQDQRCGSCRPCLLFGFAGESTALRGRISVEDATIRDARSSLRPHVAIDRFTGGARDQALYEHEVVAEGTFTLQVRWLLPPSQDATEATDSNGPASEAEQDTRLLNAALEDLHEGYVGIGARTTAGYGSVRVEACRSKRFELTELAGALRNPATAPNSGTAPNHEGEQ